ncbi:MAG: SMC-Scp complex subunit ScpB [Patescibacteria group bacterium]
MITTSIESILFAASKPVLISVIKKTLDVSDEVFNEALEDIEKRYNTEDSGIHLIKHDNRLQFVTNPSQAEIVKSLQKQENSGELTRPQLETLTIIAYRGPITKPEIEQIRGINCSLIIRNLLIRGLIFEQDDKERLQPVYVVSVDFMQHLGLHTIEELPEYSRLNTDEKISEIMHNNIFENLDSSLEARDVKCDV